MMEKKVFQAKRDCLSQVMNFITEQLEKWDCGMKEQMQIELAIEEIFVNIASYAYPDGEGIARISLALDESTGKVGILIEDEGIPYNPLEKEDPDVNQDAKERQIGGLGIYMVKKSMDEVAYQWENGWNQLTIQKKIR